MVHGSRFGFSVLDARDLVRACGMPCDSLSGDSRCYLLQMKDRDASPKPRQLTVHVGVWCSATCVYNLYIIYKGWSALCVSHGAD